MDPDGSSLNNNISANPRLFVLGPLGMQQASLLYGKKKNSQNTRTGVSK